MLSYTVPVFLIFCGKYILIVAEPVKTKGKRGGWKDNQNTRTLNEATTLIVKWSAHKYLELWQKNQYRVRTVRKLLPIITEKRIMILCRRENSINDLKNESNSKMGIVIHVMVIEPFISLKYYDSVQIEMHFLQNESVSLLSLAGNGIRNPTPFIPVLIERDWLKEEHDFI
jgi:hypothetical protein